MINYKISYFINYIKLIIFLRYKNQALTIKDARV